MFILGCHNRGGAAGFANLNCDSISANIPGGGSFGLLLHFIHSPYFSSLPLFNLNLTRWKGRQG